ncbi:hypothetical protein ACHQM5_000843 [Ranunculus cassubicifolius]
MEKITEFLKEAIYPYNNYLLLLVLPFLYFIFKSPKHLPPGPIPWPIIGNIFSLGTKPHVSLAQISASYGPLISLRLGTKLLVVGSSQDAAIEILKTHDKVLSARSVPQAVPVYPDRLDISVGWSDCNDKWKALRTLIKTELFSPRMVEAQATIREKKVSEMIEFLRTNEGEMVSIGDLVSKVVFNMLGNIFVSKDLMNLYEDSKVGLKGYVRKFVDVLSTPNLADFYKVFSGLDLQGLNKKNNEIYIKACGFWETAVKDRKENKSSDGSRHRDFVDGLLERGFDNEQINYLFVDLLFAGADTTASTVEWALAELIKSPESMEKVRFELEREVKGDFVRESDLSSLPYIHCVLKETLRLHPPAPLLIPHRAAETCKVMNYTIPKDTQIFVNVWAIGRDPKCWDDPMTFKPERFLETSLELNTNDFKFLPFGSGRRICPGLPMADKQVPLILSSLLYSFDWSLPYDMQPNELDMEEKFGLTLQKEVALALMPKFKK